MPDDHRTTMPQVTVVDEHFGTYRHLTQFDVEQTALGRGWLVCPAPGGQWRVGWPAVRDPTSCQVWTLAMTGIRRARMVDCGGDGEPRGSRDGGSYGEQDGTPATVVAHDTRAVALDVLAR